MTSATLAWEKWKEDPENTLRWKYVVKAWLHGTAEEAQRKGYSGLEVGSYP